VSLRRRYLLCADDFALTAGVSAAILTLAGARRISGTAAITTTREWSTSAQTVRGLRGQIAIGLHLNLTLGAPLGPMPRHAAAGRFPPVEAWIRRAWTGRLDLAEVGREIDRQFARFEAVAGAAPDYVDGHHHVHALPGVRRALLQVLATRYPAGRAPLVRIPGDRVRRLLSRGGPAIPKGAVVMLASHGARAALRRQGIMVNDGFAGFSPFDRALSFAQELARFERAPGPFHLVMCHPGHADAHLVALDPVAARREDEFRALMDDASLPDRIFHPAEARGPDGRIHWGGMAA
jgi:hypothetical protein